MNDKLDHETKWKQLQMNNIRRERERETHTRSKWFDDIVVVLVIVGNRSVQIVSTEKKCDRERIIFDCQCYLWLNEQQFIVYNQK